MSELPYSEIIVNEHLTLRQMQPQESADLFAVVDSDREHLGEWLAWVETTRQPADMEKFVRLSIESRKNGTDYAYAIYFDGEICGFIDIKQVQTERPSIGYWLTSKLTGKGIMTNAAQAITDFGFNELALGMIMIRAQPKNFGSNRVAEKIGYQLTDSTELVDGKVHNVWIKKAPANH